MKKSVELASPLSRRGFLGSAAAAAAAGSFAFAPGAVREAAAASKAPKLDSTINGVKLGIIVAPGVFGGPPATADDILHTCQTLGLSWVEIQNSPIETFLGAPQPPKRPDRDATAEEKEKHAAETKRANAELRSWRLSQSMESFRDFRRKYDAAGVTTDVFRFNPMGSVSPEEVEYAFEVARALGAHGLSCEPRLSQTKELGKYASRHGIMLGYHGHTNTTSTEAFGRQGAWEQAFFYSPMNGANFDIGHFTSANGDPAQTVNFVREYHDRITNLHIKDRKINGPNVPWGEGDTPLREVLLLMRDNRYPFQATIEFEHTVPAGSTVIAEMKKCADYARAILNS